MTVNSGVARFHGLPGVFETTITTYGSAGDAPTSTNISVRFYPVLLNGHILKTHYDEVRIEFTEVESCAQWPNDELPGLARSSTTMPAM